MLAITVWTAVAEMKRTRFIKRDMGFATSWDKANEEMKRQKRRREGETCKKSPVRHITHGSKFPLNHFYSTQAILLKEEAVRLCPTFHLCLTFTSSTQFYHSECYVYFSSDVVVVTRWYVLLLLKPCRPPNHLPKGKYGPHWKSKSVCKYYHICLSWPSHKSHPDLIKR